MIITGAKSCCVLQNDSFPCHCRLLLTGDLRYHYNINSTKHKAGNSLCSVPLSRWLDTTIPLQLLVWNLQEQNGAGQCSLWVPQVLLLLFNPPTVPYSLIILSLTLYGLDTVSLSTSKRRNFSSYSFPPTPSSAFISIYKLHHWAFGHYKVKYFKFITEVSIVYMHQELLAGYLWWAYCCSCMMTMQTAHSKYHIVTAWGNVM